MKIAQVKNLENVAWENAIDITSTMKDLIHDVAEKMSGCVCPDCSKVVGSARSLEVLITNMVAIALLYDDNGEVIDVDLDVAFGSVKGLKDFQANYK